MIGAGFHLFIPTKSRSKRAWNALLYANVYLFETVKQENEEHNE